MPCPNASLAGPRINGKAAAGSVDPDAAAEGHGLMAAVAGTQACRCRCLATQCSWAQETGPRESCRRGQCPEVGQNKENQGPKEYTTFD